MNAFKSLFRTVEYIWIESCEMECMVDTIGGNHTATFGNLVRLYLEEMSCLRTICEGMICLSKLKTLEVKKCKKLEYIFPISVARGLPQLERLELRDLPQLKKVYGQNREGGVGDCEIESHHQPSGVPKLKTIEVLNCENLEYIFPISIARDLPQLESLQLRDLPQLKQVFGHEERGDDGDGNNSVLSKLRNLRLWKLPELVSLGGGNSSSVWPSLKTLDVENCPKVKLSFFANVEANVPAVQKVIS